MLILNKKHKPLRKTIKMKRNEKGFGAVELLVIIVVIGLIGAVGWLVYDRQKSKQNNAETTQQPSSAQPVAKNDTKQEADTLINPGWKRYTSERLKISFEYPSDWYVNESSEDTISVSTHQGEYNKGTMPSGYQNYNIRPLTGQAKAYYEKNEQDLKSGYPQGGVYGGPHPIKQYVVNNQNNLPIRVYDYVLGERPEELDAYWTDPANQQWVATNWRDRGMNAKTGVLKQILPTIKNL